MQPKNPLRASFLGLILMSAATAAAATPVPETFNEAAFEKRFKAADTGNTGKLSREQAYAAFPRMPEFFDEIDANRDNAITLLEVQNAMERRVNAAIDASQIGSQYSGAAEMQNGGTADDTPSRQQFSNQAEARRYHRYQYYDSLAGSQEEAANQGALVPADPMRPLPAAPMQIDKSF